MTATKKRAKAQRVNRGLMSRKPAPTDADMLHRLDSIYEQVRAVSRRASIPETSRQAALGNAEVLKWAIDRLSAVIEDES